jgi:hypothetical protein
MWYRLVWLPHPANTEKCAAFVFTDIMCIVMIIVILTSIIISIILNSALKLQKRTFLGLKLIEII